MKIVFSSMWKMRLVSYSRLLIIMAIFYGLHEYTKPVFGFIFIAYILLKDISDIESSLGETQDREMEAWTNISSKRKQF